MGEGIQAIGAEDLVQLGWNFLGSRDDNENVGCKTSLPCGMRGTQASERSNSSCLVSSVISLGDNRMSTRCDQQCMIPMAVGRLEPLARH